MVAPVSGQRLGQVLAVSLNNVHAVYVFKVPDRDQRRVGAERTVAILFVPLAGTPKAYHNPAYKIDDRTAYRVSRQTNRTTLQDRDHLQRQTSARRLGCGTKSTAVVCVFHSICDIGKPFPRIHLYPVPSIGLDVHRNDFLFVFVPVGVNFHHFVPETISQKSCPAWFIFGAGVWCVRLIDR